MSHLCVFLLLVNPLFCVSFCFLFLIPLLSFLFFNSSSFIPLLSFLFFHSSSFIPLLSYSLLLFLTLSSMFLLICFLVLLLLFSLYVLSFSWLYVYFSSTFYFSFSSVSCFHQCCPLLMYSLFLLFIIIFFLLSCSLSCFSYFLFFFFLSLFVLLTMYSSNMTPPKKTLKPDLFFTDKTGPGLANFTKIINMGKHGFMLPNANKIWGNSVCHGFRTIILWTLTHKCSRPYHQPSEKGTAQPKKPMFIVFCYLHLYIKTQLQEIMSSRSVTNGPFLRHPTCMSRKEHHHQNPHNSETAEHSWNSPKPPKYLHLQCEIDMDSGGALTWIVG